MVQFRCNYLSNKNFCRASPSEDTSYRVNTQTIEDYCLNESKVSSCKRLLIFQEHMKAPKNSNPQSIIQQNFNAITGNSITNIVNLSFVEKVEQAFSEAYKMVEVKELSEAEKEEINLRLIALETEAKKDRPNVIKVSDRLNWLKKKASFVVPAIISVITEVIKKKIGV
jgi:hypothetical protein